MTRRRENVLVTVSIEAVLLSGGGRTRPFRLSAAPYAPSLNLHELVAESAHLDLGDAARRVGGSKNARRAGREEGVKVGVRNLALRQEAHVAGLDLGPFGEREEGRPRLVARQLDDHVVVEGDGPAPERLPDPQEESAVNNLQRRWVEGRPQVVY